MDHLKNVADNNQRNSIAKHMRRVHNDQPQPIKSRILARHTNCLDRFVDESLRIEKGEATVGLANSKAEWGQGSKLVRLRASRSDNQP